MFGSTPTESEAPFRRQAARIWRWASVIGRQASLRLAVLLYGERVDPETLAVTLDGERHLIMGIWAQLAVQSSADGGTGGQGDRGSQSGESLSVSPSPHLAVAPRPGRRAHVCGRALPLPHAGGTRRAAPRSHPRSRSRPRAVRLRAHAGGVRAAGGAPARTAP